MNLDPIQSDFLRSHWRIWDKIKQVKVHTKYGMKKAGKIDLHFTDDPHNKIAHIARICDTLDIEMLGI
jgi:hypothetical protein